MEHLSIGFVCGVVLTLLFVWVWHNDRERAKYRSDGKKFRKEVRSYFDRPVR